MPHASAEALAIPFPRATTGGSLPPKNRSEQSSTVSALPTLEKRFLPFFKNISYIAKNLHHQAIDINVCAAYIALTPALLEQAGFSPELINFSQHEDINQILLRNYFKGGAGIYHGSQGERYFLLVGDENHQVPKAYIQKLDSFDDIYGGLMRQSWQISNEGFAELMQHSALELAFADLCCNHNLAVTEMGGYVRQKYYSLTVPVGFPGLSPEEIQQLKNMQPISFQYLNSEYRPVEQLPTTLRLGLFTKLNSVLRGRSLKTFYTKELPLSFKVQDIRDLGDGRYQVIAYLALPDTATEVDET